MPNVVRLHIVQVGSWTSEERAVLMKTFGVLKARKVASHFEEGETDEGEPWFSLHSSEDADAFASISRVRKPMGVRYVMLDREGQPKWVCDTLVLVLFHGVLGGDIAAV